MNDDVRGMLETAGVQLAALTAGVHLYVGIPRLWIYVQAGTPFVDPTQVLFVLSGIAIFVGITLWARGLRRDVVYAGGIVLMLCYLVGWLLLGGHGSGIAPAWQETGHSHGTALSTLVEHLFSSRWLVLTKVTELLLLGILVVLLVAHVRHGAATGGLWRREDAADADD